MKFGRIFNKGSKNALREDLAVSDPGSEDSWDQLFQKVPLDNATKEGPAAVLPPINLSNRSTAFCPSNVQSNPVKDSEKDLKGRTSVDKNSAVSKNVSKNVHVATTSISKNAKQGSSHSNVQQLNPVTSTPFGREKPAPSFEFSPIILSVKGNEHNAGQEDASLSVDSNASLVVKRKSSARQKDAFDRLLDPRKRVGEETTCQFPGILPLKCLSKEVDTTRQYAGGIIRGEKTYQEQFLDFVSDEATLPESQKEVPGRTQSPHSHGKATEKCKEIPVDNVVGQIQSKEDLAPASNEKSPKISIRISAVESAGTTRTAQIESLKSVDGNGCHNTNPQKIDKSPVDTLPLPASEIPQSDDDINFQKPVANKTALKKSSCEEIGPCESKSAKIKSLGNNQESEKESKAEMVSIPLVGSSTCLVAGEALKNQSNDGHLNEECQEPVKDGNRISGERMISYQSGFAIKVGNTCLKQSSTFTFALQGKSSSHLPLLNSEVQSKNLPQRKDLEEGVRSYYNSNILLSQKKSEKARQKSPEDLFRNAMKAEGPSSLSPKSKRPDSSVKNVDTLNVGCPPAKSRSPSTIEIRKNTPSRGELCAKSVAGKMDSATEKPTEIFSNPHEAVSSSEEENIVLRAQSKILRENQSNSSRATKSPKIINTEAQGLHSQFLGKRLRFSAVLQSPPKHSAKDIQEKNDAQTPILSNCIRFDKSLTPKHECNTSLQKECNNSSDSSFDVGVLVSRNPIDVSKTHDDSFELEIMSSSADELKHFNEKTKHVADSLHNVQEKTKVKKGGSSSSRVKEMRQRKEARIEALLNSYADDSDCESQGTAPPTVKDGLEPGSGKKSQKDKIAFGARRPGQFRKAIRKNQNKEREMSAESPPSSQERVPWTTAPLNLDDNHFLSGQPQEKCETQETAIEKTNAQSGGVSKQLENLDIKTGKGNRAIKIGSKESTKQEFQEKDIINPTSSQENFPLTEPMYLNDNYFLNEKPEEKRHTQENVFVPRKSLSGGDTKQLKDLYFKSGKRNRAMKMPTKKLTIKSSERRDICPSMPNKTNGEEVSSKRCSQRVRRPPSMYWLGRRTQISTLHTEDEVLTQKNPSPSQAMTDIDMLDHGYDGQKSKGQKRKALQPKKNKNIKVSKKKKSSESEQSSEHNELQSSLPEKIYIGRAKKDVSCSKNEVQEFRCVQGSGVKGDILALGVGAKYENVFYNQNQVFYLLEGDISYECSNEKATLASGSFFIVPHGQHFIITNISNSTTKLVVATSRL